ncbi:MAG: hypothetical protein IKE63_02250 [Bacilli bacterium]|nr:hypothetical protein [Bacilli bacterium]
MYTYGYPVYQNNNDGFANSWWAIFIVIIIIFFLFWGFNGNNGHNNCR